MGCAHYCLCGHWCSAYVRSSSARGLRRVTGGGVRPGAGGNAGAVPSAQLVRRGGECPVGQGQGQGHSVCSRTPTATSGVRLLLLVCGRAGTLVRLVPHRTLCLWFAHARWSPIPPPSPPPPPPPPPPPSPFTATVPGEAVFQDTWQCPGAVFVAGKSAGVAGHCCRKRAYPPAHSHALTRTRAVLVPGCVVGSLSGVGRSTIGCVRVAGARDRGWVPWRVAGRAVCRVCASARSCVCACVRVAVLCRLQRQCCRGASCWAVFCASTTPRTFPCLLAARTWAQTVHPSRKTSPPPHSESGCLRARGLLWPPHVCVPARNCVG
jgi:hypothetical protein